ncbi:FYVE-domain-containing protein [Rhizoclosmatium globosum]|uniref:FYVE-domain-containing protein n=1 Tax=Rhizoclosmatium globosum TaxID=329046 RepID=A0A1Y2BXK1_9FUNG|nr:FYVE-domain-containing protein [Rhizoclosmatium globosum]|eukprot:ORY39499.1 FYVE-domain-containing protein [Rhizoclosmatium globosum]
MSFPNLLVAPPRTRAPASTGSSSSTGTPSIAGIGLSSRDGTGSEGSLESQHQHQQQHQPRYPSGLKAKHPLFRSPSPERVAEKDKTRTLSAGEASNSAALKVSQKHTRAATDPPTSSVPVDPNDGRPLPLPPVPASSSFSQPSLNAPQKQHSLPPPSNSSASASASVYACPICGQLTKNLLHLNHHLDTIHSISSTTSDDDDDPGKIILDWFKKTGENAKSVLNKTGENLGLKKAVSMDLLNSLAAQNPTSKDSSAPIDTSTFDLNPNLTDKDFLPDGSVSAAAAAAGFVTRKHWQPDNLDSPMPCNFPRCPKQLIPSGVKMGKMVVGAAGVGAIRVHCRKCGKVYCEEHVAHQMRLNPTDARHDSVNGVWCRVCESCFLGKEGWFDSHGVTHTRTTTFLQYRKTMSDVVALEVNKLESRYEKLAALYDEIPVMPSTKKKTLSRLTSFASVGPNLKDIEQSVVSWQDDSEVSNCPICTSTFSTLFNPLNRRHHCRLCGRVVCGLETCISQIPLIPKETTSHLRSSGNGDQTSDKPRVTSEVKVCTDCKKLVFRRKNAVLEHAQKAEVVALYEEFLKLKTNVEEVLPKFNHLIMALSSQNIIRMEDKEYIIASRHRKTLMDYFAEIEKLGKRIKSLPAPSSQHQKLQDNIQMYIIQYLQTKMFSLTLMPKVTPPPGSNLMSKVQSTTLAEMQRIDAANKALEVMEDQEKALRVQLEDALKRRKLEDAGALREALEEVEREIVMLKKDLRLMQG